MVHMQLWLSGKELRKLSCIVHENVENEITLCGKNIHNAVRTHKIVDNSAGIEMTNIGVLPDDKMLYSPDTRVMLEINTQDIQLEELAQKISN